MHFTASYCANIDMQLFHLSVPADHCHWSPQMFLLYQSLLPKFDKDALGIKNGV